METLLGHYSFADKQKPWKMPGIVSNVKKDDELSAIVKSIKRQTGKTVLNAHDLSVIN